MRRTREGRVERCEMGEWDWTDGRSAGEGDRPFGVVVPL